MRKENEKYFFNYLAVTRRLDFIINNPRASSHNVQYM